MRFRNFAHPRPVLTDATPISIGGQYYYAGSGEVSIAFKMSSPGNLSFEDFREVVNGVIDAVDKWHNIGIQLGLHEEDLRLIERRYSRQTDRFREMVREWLTTGNATWSAMVDALDSRVVGEHFLAERLKNEYCSIAQDFTEQSKSEQL